MGLVFRRGIGIWWRKTVDCYKAHAVAHFISVVVRDVVAFYFVSEKYKQL